MLEVLDTAGQEEYMSLRDQWIRDGEGFVLVYSITSRASFTRIKKFHTQIQRVKESTASTATSPFPGTNVPAGSASAYGPAPIMLIANKIDRVTEREVSTQEGTALAKQLGCEFVEASAKNCINVEKGFYDVVRALRKQRHQGTRPAGSKPSPGAHTGRHSSKDEGSKSLSRREKVKKPGKDCVIL